MEGPSPTPVLEGGLRSGYRGGGRADRTARDVTKSRFDTWEKRQMRSCLCVCRLPIYM